MPKRRLHSYDVHEISLVKRPDIKRRFAVLKSQHDIVTKEQAHAMAENIKKASRLPALDNAPNQDPTLVQGNLDQQAQRSLQAVARTLAPYRDQITAQDLMSLAQAIGLSLGSASVDFADPDQTDDDNNVDAGQDYTGQLVDAGDGANDSDAEQALAAEDTKDNGDDTDMEDQVDADDDDSALDGGDRVLDNLALHVPKPANVDGADHHEAVGAAKTNYLDTLKKKGYNLKPKGQMPAAKGKTMSKESANKSALDVSALTPAEREKLEPIFKSVAERQNELEAINKSQADKIAQMATELGAMRDAAEHKALTERVASMRNLTDTDKLVSIAKSLSGDAREDYLVTLKATNAQIEEIKKASGADLFTEVGSRTGGVSPMNGDKSAEQQLEELAASLVEKSGEKLTPAQAYEKALMTPQGRRLYAASQARN